MAAEETPATQFRRHILVQGRAPDTDLFLYTHSPRKPCLGVETCSSASKTPAPRVATSSLLVRREALAPEAEAAGALPRLELVLATNWHFQERAPAAFFALAGTQRHIDTPLPLPSGEFLPRYETTLCRFAPLALDVSTGACEGWTVEACGLGATMGEWACYEEGDELRTLVFGCDACPEFWARVDVVWDATRALLLAVQPCKFFAYTAVNARGKDPVVLRAMQVVPFFRVALKPVALQKKCEAWLQGGDASWKRKRDAE